MSASARQQAQATGDFAAAHRALLGDPSIQFGMAPVPPPPGPPAWLEPVLRWLGHLLRPIGRLIRWLGSFVPDAPYARILLWGVIAIVALMLVWIVVTRVRDGVWRWPHRRRARTLAAIPDEADWSPDAAPVRAWLDQADALAAQGRYAEAVHHLLFRSIEDIERRRPGAVRPALTSRDLARADAIPRPVRTLFADIAALVERSLFGGLPLRAEDWQTARAAYAEFALPKAWGRMSDAGAAGGEDAFSPRLIAIILGVGLLGFVGMLLLGAFAPDLRSGRNGGAHALSNAATGYSGIVALAGSMGRGPRVIRNVHQLDTEDLVILTPEHGTTDMTAALAARSVRPTLLVLPKWATQPDPAHAGWVRYVGLAPVADPQGVLWPQYKLRIGRHRSGGRPLVGANGLPRAMAFTAPRPLQVILNSDGTPVGPDGTALRALLTDRAGGIVVGQLGTKPLFVLTDPDLLSNLGMRDPAQARSALALLDWLNATGARTINFDVTLNGFGHSRSPLKLAFEPPFLAMTLAIVAALGLAGWQATTRFGSVRPRPRTIAFGKTALVDNAAALIRKAGREAALGGRYADLIRERAVTAFGVPARLDRAETDVYLNGARGGTRFSTLANDAAYARDRTAVLAAARALHDWLGNGK